jgi:hypothetical protein
MRKKASLIASLIICISLQLGFTLKSNSIIEKTHSTSDTIKSAETGTVYLYRVGRAVGLVLKTQIKVNGLDAGGTSSNSYFEWNLEPGVYTFSCFTKESNAVVEIDVKPNEKYYLRQDTRMGLTNEGRVTLKQVDASKGAKEIKKCNKLVSIYR